MVRASAPSNPHRLDNAVIIARFEKEALHATAHEEAPDILEPLFQTSQWSPIHQYAWDGCLATDMVKRALQQ